MAHSFFLELTALKERLKHYSWRAFMRLIHALQQQDQKIDLRHRALPDLSFAPRELQQIEFANQENCVEVILAVNFLGLQGAATPLPIHYTESVLHEEDPDESNLNEFYNFFNQHFYAKLFAIEKKYHYLLQTRSDHNDQYTQKLTAFAGFLEKNISCALISFEESSCRDFRSEYLNRQLFSHLHILLGRNLAKSNWCRMIANLVGAKQAWIAERVPKRLGIPEKFCNRLGKNSRLGETLSLGAYVTQAKNHMELHLSVEELETFLPNMPACSNLKALVNATLPANLFLSLVLHAQQAKSLQLDSHAPVGLGWSSKLGRYKIEPAVIMVRLI